jgi:hypothetical protein
VLLVYTGQSREACVIASGPAHSPAAAAARRGRGQTAPFPHPLVLNVSRLGSVTAFFVYSWAFLSLPTREGRYLVRGLLAVPTSVGNCLSLLSAPGMPSSFAPRFGPSL